MEQAEQEKREASPEPSVEPKPPARRAILLEKLPLWLLPVPAIAILAVADHFGGRRWAAVSACVVAGFVLYVFADQLIAKATARVTIALVAFAIAVVPLAVLAGWNTTGTESEGTRADLPGQEVKAEMLTDLDFRGARLAGARMNELDLRSESLAGAEAPGASLSEAKLQGVNLRGADLKGANLSQACLRGADLAGAELNGANVTGADLEGVVLTYDQQRFLIGYPSGPTGSCDE